MKQSLVCLGLLCATAVATGSNAGSPVERIVKMLEDVKATTVGDGKAEQQIYDKYACWCETTSARKANNIVDAQNDLRALGQRILKLKGTVATRAAEIAELSDDITSNENEQEMLTSVREKQNAAWAAESAETKQALAALQSAINVLAKATTPGLIQVSEMMMKHAVKSVLDTLPSTVGLPPARMALLSEFLSAKTGYAPQSATIQGMLGDMYLTFSNNLESSTLDEANQNADFEEMFATLEKSNNQMKKTRAKKETEKAEAESMLADTTKAYDDTEKQMKADTKFFDTTKAACESKHEEWEVRVQMRDSELEGIDAALTILTSDENRKLFADSIAPGVGFLQLTSATAPALLQEGAPSARAYNVLKTQVKKSHSVRLAALAVQIRTSKAGHFDKVISDIDGMIKTLGEEGADDLDKKNQCLDEYQNVAKTVNDLDWKLKNNEAKIEKLQKLIELRTQEREDTIQKTDETNDYIDQITKERKAENEAYLKAKKDDEDAIVVLDSAKAAFAKFQTKQGINMMQEPEFARSEDAAPDATFTKKGSNKVASKSILELFDYILEDLADELSNGKKDEAKSQADFADELATAEQLVDDLTSKRITLEGIISKRKGDKEEENQTKKKNNVDRTAELGYKAKIAPDCNWIMKAFDQRAEAREAEINGLTTAKEFLAGKTALIEESKKFDDTKLASIGFLGMH